MSIKNISNDSMAIILLCSHLGLPPKPDPPPLTLTNWNPVALELSRAGMRPGDLLGKSPREIEGLLAVKEEEAARMAGLLCRDENISSELERLFSLGIWLLTRADEDYPQRYRERLGKSAPVVIFGAGDNALVGDPGIAVVGSRNVDQAGQELAEFIGSASAYNGMVVYSGGARGVDQFSMKAAVEGRGHAVGVLAHSLVKSIRDRNNQRALSGGNLTLITPYSPYAGFSVGAAMGRNKLIYGLAPSVSSGRAVQAFTLQWSLKVQSDGRDSTFSETTPFTRIQHGDIAGYYEPMWRYRHTWGVYRWVSMPDYEL